MPIKEAAQHYFDAERKWYKALADWNEVRKKKGEDVDKWNEAEIKLQEARKEWQQVKASS